MGVLIFIHALLLKQVNMIEVHKKHKLQLVLTVALNLLIHSLHAG